MRPFESYIFLIPTDNHTDMTLSIRKTSKVCYACFFPKISVTNSITHNTAHEFPEFFENNINYSAWLSFKHRFKLYR